MVAVLLDISQDTIRRALINYEESGDVVRTDEGTVRGRKRLLNEEDHQVCAIGFASKLIDILTTYSISNSSSVVW
jgi:DeoR/GlpR family transcriptional regulator of sugar metabolism